MQRAIATCIYVAMVELPIKEFEGSHSLSLSGQSFNNLLQLTIIKHLSLISCGVGDQIYANN